MAGKDIDIVIRAKDKASKEFEAIAKAIKDYNGEQADIVKGAGKTSKALGDLGSDVKKLQSELNRLQSAGKIAASLDQASAAATRMESSIKGSAVELAKLGRESAEAAKNADRLRGALQGEEAALAQNKQGLRDSQRELAQVKKSLEQNADAQNRYNKAVFNVPETKLRPAVRSAGTLIAGDIAQNQAQQARINAEIRQYEQEIERSTTAIKNLKPQIDAAAGLQDNLAKGVKRAESALVAEKAALAGARTELESIKGVAAQAGTALGNVALNQEQVAAAATRMAANLAAAKARIEGLSNVKKSTVIADPADPESYNQQVLALRKARQEFIASQIEVKKLAAEMKNASSPTEALGAAFGAAQARVERASNALKAQQVAIRGVANAAKSGFGAWAAAVIPLEGATKKVAVANNQIASSANNAAVSERSLATFLRQIAAEMVNAAGKTDQFGASLKRVQTDGHNTVSVVQRLRGEVASLAAGYVGFQAAVSQIGGAISAYQTLEAAQSRLGVVFNQDTGKVAAEISFLRETADRLGFSFGTLADEYGKFALSAKSANLTAKDTRTFFIAVSDAARVNKLSTEQMAGAFLAFTQMLSKGKISAEELRGQLAERLPGAFELVAAALGKSTAELNNLLEKGDVLANRDTFGKIAAELTERFSPQLAAALDSASADIGRFENNIFNMQGTIANGLVPGLRSAVQSFDEFSKSTEGQEAFRDVGEVIGQLLQLLAEVPKHFDKITFAAKVFAAIKLADALTNIATKTVATTAAAIAYNRELSFIGPRTQTAAQSQSVLNRAFGQTVGTLGSYRQSLLASTTASNTARIGIVGLAGAVGSLRAVLLVTGAVARSFLAMFGGPIGLAITGITIAIGTWLMTTDQATAAIDEHRRQVQAMAEAYQGAEDKAGNWAKKVASVTEAQAQQNVLNLREALGGVISDMAALSRVLKAAFSDFPETSPQIQQYNRLAKAIQSVADGSADIKSLSDVLNDIALNPTDEQFKDIALQLLEIINTSKDGKPTLLDLANAVEVAEANLRRIQGTATEADEALLNTGKSAKEATGAFDKTAAIKTYADAIDTLTSKIPGLAEELKKLKDITEINKTAWEGMIAAFQAGDFRAIARIIGLWSQAGAATQTAANQKLFDSLPDTSKTVVDRIIFIEGGQTPATDTVKSGSNAQGIGQSIPGTWLPLFDRLFPALSQLSEAQKLAYRYDEAYARPILEQLAKQNQMALANAGQAPTPGNTYLAHFLGSGDAVKVLLANPDALAKDIVQANSVKANPTVIKENTTARDLIAWANQKMGGGSPIMSGGMTRQENTDQDVALRVKALREEANARAESNREGAIAKELETARNAAIKDGTSLTKEQEQAIRDAAAAKYDSLHADEALRAKQEEAREALAYIVGLDQQRKTLLEQINMAQQAGDNSTVAELTTQLTDINGQLDELIPKALEFARALDDQKMIASLAKVQLNTAKVGQQFSFLGLSFEQTRQLATNFADGVVGAIDSFAQAVANGEDRMTALRNAFMQFAADFLREMAKMILQKMMFNLINTAVPGLNLGGAVPAGHTGGVVGSAAIGGGNPSRNVPAEWFTNAMRYHSGGIVGFRPDEIPAVLKKNEEVLTEEDPRHRFNTDKTASAQQNPQTLKQVLVLDPKDLATAMASTAGTKVILTALKNNASTVKSILG